MFIRRSKRFISRVRRLSHTDKKAVIETIEVFGEDPRAPSLDNHELRGSMTRQRSISVDDDLRIIFSVKGDYEEVLFLDIGTHDKVYRD